MIGKNKKTGGVSAKISEKAFPQTETGGFYRPERDHRTIKISTGLSRSYTIYIPASALCLQPPEHLIFIPLDFETTKRNPPTTRNTSEALRPAFWACSTRGVATGLASSYTLQRLRVSGGLLLKRRNIEVLPISSSICP